MSLTRNQIARNKNFHTRSGITRVINKRINLLESICDKHKVGNLTFKTCNLISHDGTITAVDYHYIKGNMKSGIIIVNTKSMSIVSGVYDLITIEHNKQAREEKKRLEEAEKAQLEKNRLRDLKPINDKHDTILTTLEEINNLPVTTTPEVPITTTPEALVTTLPEPVTTTPEVPITTLPEPVTTTPEVPITTTPEALVTLPESVTTLPEPVTTIPEEPVTTVSQLDNIEVVERPSKATNKKNAMIKQYNEQLKTKAASSVVGNKYCRYFMNDFSSKFTYHLLNQYKYFEVRAETTDMVIDRVQIYQIEMPKMDKVFLLVKGDLQLKSGLTRTIDPNYNADDVVQEQSEFMDRIIAKENNNL